MTKLEELKRTAKKNMKKKKGKMTAINSVRLDTEYLAFITDISETVIEEVKYIELELNIFLPNGECVKKKFRYNPASNASFYLSEIFDILNVDPEQPEEIIGLFALIMIHREQKYENLQIIEVVSEEEAEEMISEYETQERTSKKKHTFKNKSIFEDDEDDENEGDDDDEDDDFEDDEEDYDDDEED